MSESAPQASVPPTKGQLGTAGAPQAKKPVCVLLIYMYVCICAFIYTHTYVHTTYTLYSQ